jgi:hypothetical protein
MLSAASMTTWASGDRHQAGSDMVGRGDKYKAIRELTI